MATALMYKGSSQRLQRHRERGAPRAIPGTAEWMRRKQAQQNRPRPTAAERVLRQRLDTEAHLQAQRAINREGRPPQGEPTVNLPLPAGLRRSPKKTSPARAE